MARVTEQEKLIEQMKETMPRARMTGADKLFREAVIQAFELLFWPPAHLLAKEAKQAVPVVEEQEEVATSSREVAPSTAEVLAKKLREARETDSDPDGEQ